MRTRLRLRVASAVAAAAPRWDGNDIGHLRRGAEREEERRQRDKRREVEDGCGAQPSTTLNT